MFDKKCTENSDSILELLNFYVFLKEFTKINFYRSLIGIDMKYIFTNNSVKETQTF